MGYKQELRRNFTMIEVFGIAFSIMGLLPSIASTLSYSIPAGPVGLVWGWFLASGCIFVVGLAMVGRQSPLVLKAFTDDYEGRFRQCNADKWWTILLDAFLCFPWNKEPIVVLGRLLE